MSIALSILKSMEADFDGDALNIMYLWNRDFIEITDQILNPVQMYISRDDGLCNPDFLPSRDMLINANSFKSIGRYTPEEIAAIDSKDITEEVLLKLARRTQEVLSESETAGVVITHGTDTLEETAYFLHLTLHTAKPVVLTGAMRPATALSADGPLNLLQAIRVASCASSVGRGVLVVANGEIHSARDVRKVHTTAVHTFQSPGLGPLGVIDDASIEYYRQTTRRHTLDSELQLPEQQRGGRYLPDVRILYGQAGDDGMFAAAACSAGVRGIVYAGFGNGSLPALVETALAAAVEQGVIVVRSTRSPEGAVLAAEPSYDEHGFIASGTLSPQQARILLQLGLLHSSDRSYILRLFREY